MEEFYSNFVTSNNVILKNDIPATHAVVSSHTGTPCGTSDNRLYIQNCGFDSVFEMLNHLLDNSLTRPEYPPSYVYSGDLRQFDAKEFFPNNDPKALSMDEFGYVYVPTGCLDGSVQCLLHIHFHGCLMEANEIGTDFITESGFLEIADYNNIIILFPQVLIISFQS